MSLSLDDLAFLSTSAGQQLLIHLAQVDLSDKNTLHLLTTLRKTYTGTQASAALEMARLRQKAVTKFGEQAQHFFFTREALEQASSPAIRHYRAECLGAVDLVDACCGIGSDSLAFAQTGARVTGVDTDEVRAVIAQHNAGVVGLQIRVLVADVTNGLPDSKVVFFDPARRGQRGNRLFDVEQYQPPLSTIRQWKQRQVIVKLSPGVDLAQLENYSGQIEFISEDGDLKEAVLWHNAEPMLQATLIANGGMFHWTRPRTINFDFEPDELLSEPHAWLVEPDPALIRARLVQDAAHTFGGQLLDNSIAYFTMPTKPDSVWLRAWQILDWMPFNLKHLRTYLRERHVGRVTVKKRGTAVTPEALIPQLKLAGSEERVLVLTRLRGQQIVMICAPYDG
ncbi:MAG: class I SAM-dependent methyltransferase [Anaerolineae bacterium]